MTQEGLHRYTSWNRTADWLRRIEGLIAMKAPSLE
jgi:hypothetical protein